MHEAHSENWNKWDVKVRKGLILYLTNEIMVESKFGIHSACLKVVKSDDQKKASTSVQMPILYTSRVLHCLAKVNHLS